ncbi:DUF6745 domain-containing protein [Actinokineospora globicatena]|uniref:DUF6745 domain-containing protein n=1 Tax=Actinokineospora globicatena TaxID=103729 RepID=UPI00255382AD|nr:hypothetical protein [Actinokineospora globicatena]
MAHALSCEPADRDSAEKAISALYSLVGSARPEFRWVGSPAAVAERSAESTVANRLLAHVSKVREPLYHWRRYRAPGDEPIFRHEHMSEVDKLVGVPLERDIRDTLLPALRDAAGHKGFTWYGQHDAFWVARLDAHRRVFAPGRADPALDAWTALARSCGWWWPGDDECVIAERPTVFALDNVPDTQRPHRDDGPAVVYPDGWAVHFWHGTAVPAWVLDDPTPARIDAERNIEVRRCALERLGWPDYLARAGTRLVATAPDPGNPGFELRLYDLPAWDAPSQLLLAVNGSVERDGTRRQYGLRVPRWFTDPVDAAAWTYGLAGAQYATLLRRT